MSNLDLSKQAKKQLKDLRVELNLKPKKEIIDLLINQIEEYAKLLADASKYINSRGQND